MQEMILAGSKEDRISALDKLEVMQTEDFRGIFEAMNGNPCTVRLLDPPLHEFLPHKQADIDALAIKVGLSYEKLKDIIEAHERIKSVIHKTPILTRSVTLAFTVKRPLRVKTVHCCPSRMPNFSASAGCISTNISGNSRSSR